MAYCRARWARHAAALISLAEDRCIMARWQRGAPPGRRRRHRPLSTDAHALHVAVRIVADALPSTVVGSRQPTRQQLLCIADRGLERKQRRLLPLLHRRISASDEKQQPSREFVSGRAHLCGVKWCAARPCRAQEGCYCTLHGFPLQRDSSLPPGATVRRRCSARQLPWILITPGGADMQGVANLSMPANNASNPYDTPRSDS